MARVLFDLERPTVGLLNVGVEEIKGNKEALVITEIPYNVCRADLVSKIADLVNQKRIEGISDIRDESDENTRVVIEIKRDAIPKVSRCWKTRRFPIPFWKTRSNRTPSLCSPTPVARLIWPGARALWLTICAP